ncbi:NEU1 [Branchiostoma lanceolatum]|uniref:Sialidase-1 n=1 Tax=Branchiostoma lanceolatum TaxID=7740 RepID=A0A8K0AAK0_BRALA|nr:NEU1 [Branchiostoma lanceolatum]
MKSYDLSIIGYFGKMASTLRPELLRWRVVFLFCTVLSVTPDCMSTGKVNPKIVSDENIWTSGVEGEIAGYRTPFMTYTPNGTILAFAGARKYSKGDAGKKIISLRRSTDKGVTWTPTAFLVDDGYDKGVLGAGTAFVDDDSNTTFVMFIHCQFHCAVPSVLLMNSTNDGVTWGQPRNITPQLQPGVVSHPSPGYGIRKRYEPHKGRLIVCAHGRAPEWGLSLLLSDDGAVTWRTGAFVSNRPCNDTCGESHHTTFQAGERQPVELPDGSVLVMTRNQLRCKCHCKAFLTSQDGGETLPISSLRFDQTLIEPPTDAALLYSDGVLYFTGPNSSSKRQKMTLRWSYDNGTSWAGELPIWPKAAGYSAITMLQKDPGDKNFLYLLYEKGFTKKGTSTAAIAFTKIQIHH